MTEVPILYNHGEVASLASDVGASAQTLHGLHDEVKNQTDAIAEFFTGEAASAFRENQLMMLSGLQDLIQVMSSHGQAIGNANDSSISTDHQMAQGFHM
jgi:WXG100 family type VII secretion target